MFFIGIVTKHVRSLSRKMTDVRRDELLSFGEQDALKHPPKDLEASGIYRYDPFALGPSVACV